MSHLPEKTKSFFSGYLLVAETLTGIKASQRTKAANFKQTPPPARHTLIFKVKDEGPGQREACESHRYQQELYCSRPDSSTRWK